MSEPDTFRCERLRCTLRVAVCLARQAARRQGPSGAPLFTDCLACPQGAELAGTPMRRRAGLAALPPDDSPASSRQRQHAQGYAPKTERPSAPVGIGIEEFLARKRTA